MGGAGWDLKVAMDPSWVHMLPRLYSQLTWSRPARGLAMLLCNLGLRFG